MVDTQSTPARQRPSIVSISSYLLFLFLACQVISLIITLSTAGKIRDAISDAYAGSSLENADQIADVAFAFIVGISILLLLLAVVLGVLALFNNQGRNGSRITTWIVGGVLVCCTGGSLLSGAGGGSFTTGGDTAGAPSGEEVQRRVEEAVPSWTTPVSLLLGVVSIIALLTALILLALPKANAFFRKPAAGWEPPTPGASYPGYPQAPGQPGYPQSTGEPGYPSAPVPGQPGIPPSSADRPDDTPPADRPGTTPPSS
ncbi:hypothetical protein F8271_18390 [Micromonospora sp. ALFpr18c]|uniref:hypothetical protein n=1 Tax=Micromonospora sp. ALFpr18c TaxID=1458665 RepID=UPI00124BA291|nr:hypothetical protein [Micromonospora sp. ALFpr18c]KAB1937956.1 hypothetical protein F8271_18390 [Micromonospora sp. ALFpr18c]